MMRRAALFAVLVAFVALPAVAEEMTLEKVLENYYEAIGGLDAWEGWETVQLTGEMSMQGGQMKAPFTMSFVNDAEGGMARLEFTIQGMTAVSAYDGEAGWAVRPFMGSTDPEPMSEEESEIWEEQADFAGPLVHPERKGVELAYEGTEEVEGTETHKIKVTRANGDVRYMYLDSEAFLPIKSEAKTNFQGQEVDIETTYGEYKDSGGLVFAHSFESRPKGAPEGAGQMIMIGGVEFDVELPDDFFAMPAPAEAPAEAEGE